MSIQSVRPSYTRMLLSALRVWNGTPEELGICLSKAFGREGNERSMARARLQATKEGKALLQYEEENLLEFLGRVRIPEPGKRVSYDYS